MPSEVRHEAQCEAQCAVRGICGGCDYQSPESSPNSTNAIAAKAAALRALLRAYPLPHLSIYASPDSGYRARGEFRVLRECSDSGVQSLPKLSLSMSARGRNSRVKVPNCPILLPALQHTLAALMPLLESSPLLSHKLYAIEVLGSRFATLESARSSSTHAIERAALDSATALYTIAPDHSRGEQAASSPQHSDVIITLIYHKPLDSGFCRAAHKLLETLLETLCQPTTTAATQTNIRTTPEPVTLATPAFAEPATFATPTIFAHSHSSCSSLSARAQSMPKCPKPSIHSLALVARSKNQKHIFRAHPAAPESSPTPESKPARGPKATPESSAQDSAALNSARLDSRPPDSICDVLMLDRPYTYLRQEGRFCQPNAYINPSMLSFVRQSIRAHEREDLLEMYGGDGNFSIALTGSFRRVLVTEVVKSAHSLIAQNARRNGIANITSARLSGAETMSALRGEREFFRLRGVDIGSFRFSHVLVDPPRSGIGDQAMLSFLAGFSCIIYISCNPASLAADLRTLAKSHTIEHAALFDQFPHTSHKECALILRKSRA